MKLKALGFVAAAMLFAAPHAGADLVDGKVDEWTLDVNVFFVPGSAVFTAGPGTTSVTPYRVDWGLVQRSAIAIAPASPLSVNVLTGDSVETYAVTHENRVLPTGTVSLDSITILANVMLTPFSPAGPGVGPIPIPFFVNFFETPNVPPAGQNCPNGDPFGDGLNLFGCADIFVINQNALSFNFFYDLDGAGSLPALEYTASLFELTAGINPLSDASCMAVGAAPGCIGFETVETADTTFQFGVSITTAALVPAPGTLALSGLGLLALGWSCRRAAAKRH